MRRRREVGVDRRSEKTADVSAFPLSPFFLSLLVSKSPAYLSQHLDADREVVDEGLDHGGVESECSSVRPFFFDFGAEKFEFVPTRGGGEVFSLFSLHSFHSFLPQIWPRQSVLSSSSKERESFCFFSHLSLLPFLSRGREQQRTACPQLESGGAEQNSRRSQPPGTLLSRGSAKKLGPNRVRPPPPLEDSRAFGSLPVADFRLR